MSVSVCVCFTWLRVAEYSGLTGRKGTALRSVTRVLWFWVVSHTGDTNMKQKINLCKCVFNVEHEQPVYPPTHANRHKQSTVKNQAVALKAESCSQ